MAGESVEFSASGGVLRTVGNETDENGEATATLALTRDYQNRDIDVTVTAGNVDSTVTVQASGTRLELAGSTSLVLGNRAQLIATLTDGNERPIGNSELVFSSQADNLVIPPACQGPMPKAGSRSP